MISEEPDEDADIPDDDAALDGYLGEAAANPGNDAAGVLEIPDWPARPPREMVLSLDAETLSWFTTNHLDWRRTIRAVLRAWVIAKTAEREISQQIAPTTEAGRPSGRP
ncbi:MAG TPA: hypothetical protein VGM32_02075 [Rhodopila sp.]|jgi:hypothetical protein